MRLQLRRRWLRHAQVLRAAPGDTIVIGHPDLLSEDQRRRIRALAQRAFPDNHVLVLDAQMDIRVVRKT